MMKKYIMYIILITISGYVWALENTSFEKMDTIKIDEVGAISVYGIFPQYNIMEFPNDKHGDFLFQVFVAFDISNENNIAFDKSRFLKIKCLAMKKSGKNQYVRLSKGFPHKFLIPIIESVYSYYFRQVKYFSTGKIHRNQVEPYNYTYFFSLPDRLRIM